MVKPGEGVGDAVGESGPVRAAVRERRGVETGKDKKDATTWAAEARYYEGELIFRDYEKISLDVKPALLERTLKAKGKMLADAQNVLYNAPGLAIYPGAAIALSVLGLNLLGDGLSDVLDPKLKTRF